MTPEQALNVLAQATEPNVRLTRADYVLINRALGVLEELIKKQAPVEEKVSGGD
jgi:hypothetical protein